MLLTQTEEFLQSWTDACSTAPSPWMISSVPIGLIALVVKSVSLNERYRKSLRKTWLPAPAGMLPGDKEASFNREGGIDQGGICCDHSVLQPYPLRRKACLLRS